MTDKEKTIVTAYTGVTMLQGEKLDLLYAYVSELIGRPVQTLDFVYMADKIQELSKPDFLKLCAEDTERHGEWIPVSERLPEEKINPVTHDFEEVPCTTIWGDVRHYKYGTAIGHDKAHFWHGFGIMDEEVVAWMPLPEPYKSEREKYV